MSSAAADPAADGYRAPWWLPSAHLQTAYPFFLPRIAVPLRRERVEIGDGDFWLFDWLDVPAAIDSPLVVVFHGLEGGSDSHYVRALFARLAALGWRGVVPHFRGCGGEANRLPRAYHSGDFAEIERMLHAVQSRVDARTPLHAVGVSLGGSALLNWLGRQGAEAARVLVNAAAVSTPLDLSAAGKAIGEGFNRVYARHFLVDLKPKALAMAQRFPGLLDSERIRRAHSMFAFDDAVTAPLHGFAGTADYWLRGSSKPWLGGVGIPTLVLNARNDPIVPGASLPTSTTRRSVLLEQPAQGGHAGFPTGPFPGAGRWLPERLLSFFRDGR
jgi:predicted alpha/beta-fold hydrolase